MDGDKRSKPFSLLFLLEKYSHHSLQLRICIQFEWTFFFSFLEVKAWLYWQLNLYFSGGPEHQNPSRRYLNGKNYEIQRAFNLLSPVSICVLTKDWKHRKLQNFPHYSRKLDFAALALKKNISSIIKISFLSNLWCKS